MKTQLVQAFSTEGKDKIHIGDKEIDVPENVSEAIEVWGETTFLKLAMKSHVIDVQRAIRGGGNTGQKQKVNDLMTAARKQAAEGDETLLNNLISAGFKL